MEEQIITLFPSQEKWIVSYYNDEDIVHFNYSDALHAMGLLAKEILRVFKAPVRTQIKDQKKNIVRESFLYPHGYIYYKDRMVQTRFL
jgi:hypothetical protein